MTLDQFVAKRIQTLRKEFGLTQEQLAEVAQLDISSIAKIERGERSNITVNTLEKIIDGFGLSMQSFFDGYKDEINGANDPSVERFQKYMMTISPEKRKKYLEAFEEIVKVEN